MNEFLNGEQSTTRNRADESGSVASRRWIRRPRRSGGDRKIAGVAGGLGRAFGVDPVLLRVAFVVLTIFGGFGGLLYVLGWLLLPADGDEVSAAESLLGRGRSSVPAPLAIGLALVAVMSALSMFSWGLPFLPLVIGGAIVLAVMRRRHRGGRSHHSRRPGWSGHVADWNHPDWNRPEAPADAVGGWTAGRPDWANRIDDKVRAFSEQAERWGDQAGRWGGQAGRWGARGPWAGSWAGNAGSRTGSDSPPRSEGSSPFAKPAFWDQPDTSARVAGPPPAGANAGGKVDMTKGAGRNPGGQNSPANLAEPSPADLWTGEPNRTPPAWDPLGAAPFAWDLQEPTPLAPLVPTRPRSVIARLTMGGSLLVGGLAAAGVLAGWWALTWAQVTGMALAVLAVGLLVAAIRGRGRSLIVPGILLSLVTAGLTFTGISGTDGYRNVTYTPKTLADLQPIYHANAGELKLDLTAIDVPPGTTKDITVELRAGHAEVITASGKYGGHRVCEAQVGQVTCLDASDDGIRVRAMADIATPDKGTLNIAVHVNAGFAEVRNG